MFALVLTPLLFTGASQYPWASLDHLRWFQLVTIAVSLAVGIRLFLRRAID